jgi:hypothetical protein
MLLKRHRRQEREHARHMLLKSQQPATTLSATLVLALGKRLTPATISALTLLLYQPLRYYYISPYATTLSALTPHYY